MNHTVFVHDGQVVTIPNAWLRGFLAASPELTLDDAIQAWLELVPPGSHLKTSDSPSLAQADGA